MMPALTARQIEVVLLVGRDNLSYKRAAAKMENQLVRKRAGETRPPISHHTVRRYAVEIRELAGLDHLSPMRAMWHIYTQHRTELEVA